MAFLYEVAAQYAEVLNNLQIDEETGEVLNAGELEIAAEEFDAKVESFALYVKNLRAEAEAIKAEQKTLGERRNALERKTERIEDALAAAMVAAGRAKFETARVALSFRRSESVAITDEGAIPLVFMRETVKYEPDKVYIKQLIKAGEAIPGARLEEKQNLQIK